MLLRKYVIRQYSAVAFYARLGSWRPRMIQDLKHITWLLQNILGFALFQISRINRDFSNIFFLYRTISNSRKMLPHCTLKTDRYQLSSLIQWSLYRSEFRKEPITVAARSKTWTVLACSNAGIVCSNPTRGMDVCVRLLYMFYVVLRIGSGLATGWSPIQGVLPTVYRSRNWKSDRGSTKGL
jgi:hypothetical protein